jgi:preprotein translocase SecE subunit
MALEVYKRGQGKFTRLGTGFGAGIIVALGCLQLYNRLQAAEWAVSRRAGLWISTMVPVGVFVLSGALIFWLLNKQTIADFMISAEGEMKKVSWSNRREIAVSTFVVIVVVVLMAFLLGATDLGFRIFFSWLLD